MPILALVDELCLPPVFSTRGMWDLRQLLQEKSIINLSLNRVALGIEAMDDCGAGNPTGVLLHGQEVGKKLVLVVDEVSHSGERRVSRNFSSERGNLDKVYLSDSI